MYLNGTLGTVEPSYKNLWNAAMNEGAVGYGWSIETWDNSPPGHFMQGLIAAEESLASGGTLVFHQVGGCWRRE